MTTYQKTNEAAYFFEIGETGFQTAQVANRSLSTAQIVSVMLLAVVAILFAGVMTLQPANSFTMASAGEVVKSQGMVAKKSDRLATTDTVSCNGQAWGAWSADCAAALTGSKSVRTVGYVTVEQTSPTVNETILARFPKAY